MIPLKYWTRILPILSYGVVFCTFSQFGMHFNSLKFCAVIHCDILCALKTQNLTHLSSYLWKGFILDHLFEKWMLRPLGKLRFAWSDLGWDLYWIYLWRSLTFKHDGCPLFPVKVGLSSVPFCFVLLVSEGSFSWDFCCFSIISIWL